MGSTRSADFVPQVLADAVRGEFRGKQAMYGSPAVMTNPSLPTDARGGDKIEVPYFDVIGKLQVTAEDVAVPIKTVGTSKEESVVQRAGLAFEMTRWKQMAEKFADPYAEYARQLREQVIRAWDETLIGAAVASGLPAGHVIDRYNAGSPVKLSYSYMVDGRLVYGDEGDGLALAFIHSKVSGDLLKELDGDNRPLLTLPNEGGLGRVAGVPVKITDRCPVEFPTITATGTTPPAVTVTGYTTDGWDKLRIEITTGGARGVAVFRYSFDGGTTWTSNVLTAATVALGETGLTATFAAGTYNVDNVYVGTPKYSTIIAAPGSMTLWYNGTPNIDDDKDILKDNKVAAIHSYFIAHRYKRRAGGTRPGIAILKHN